MSIFSRRILTLHVEEGEARAVVMKGSRVTHWASVAIPRDVVSAGFVEDPDELAELLKELLRRVRVRSRRPLVSLGGVHQVVRVLNLPRLKRALLVEAINAEMRRELANPIEEFQIHWVPIESSKTRIRVYVLAVPNNEVASFMTAFRAARLKPRRVYLESMALAPMLKGKDGVIVGFKNQGFSILVARDGIPVTMREISYSQEDLPLADRAEDVGRELQLTLASFASEQEDAPAGSSWPTFLVGKHASDSYLADYVSREVGSNATRLELPAEYTEGFPSLEYAANLGIALNRRRHRFFFPASKTDFTFDLTHTDRLRTPVPVLQGVLLLLLVAAAASVVNPLQEATTPEVRETQLQAQIGQIESDIEGVRQDIRRGRNIEASLTEEAVKAQQLEAGLEEITSQRLSWTEVLARSQESFPNVKVVSFEEDSHTLTITAKSPDVQRAVAFTDYLSQIGRFTSVSIQGLTLESQDGGRSIRFDLIANKGE